MKLSLPPVAMVTGVFRTAPFFLPTHPSASSRFVIINVMIVMRVL